MSEFYQKMYVWPQLILESVKFNLSDFRVLCPRSWLQDQILGCGSNICILCQFLMMHDQIENFLIWHLCSWTLYTEACACATAGFSTKVRKMLYAW